MKALEQKRYIWIDILKILACFLVIIDHSHSYLLHHMKDITTFAALFYTIGFSICKQGVPVFIILSGYLLLKKEQNYKMILKRIYRIVIPLVLLSLFLYVKNIGISNINVLDFINKFMEEPFATHLWYLYMLIGLYMVTPFVKKMVYGFKDKDYKVFLLFFLIFPGLLQMLSTVFKVTFSNYYTMSLFPVIIGFYVYGNYLSKIDSNKKLFKLSLLTYISTLLIMIIQMFSVYMVNGKIVYDYADWSSLLTILGTLSITYIGKYLFENKEVKHVKIINEISNTTFGIYLIHYFVNYEIYEITIMQHIFDFSPYIGVLVLEILCFISCSIVVYMLRKIKFIKQFL